MIRGSARPSTTTIRLGLFSFVISILFLIYIPSRTRHSDSIFSQSYNAISPNKAATFHTTNDDYWNALREALEDTRPRCSPIVHKYKGLGETDKHFEPLLPHKPHPHNINMTDEAEKELMRAHYAMRRTAFRLGQSMPFVKDSTGIVVTSSPDQIAYLLVSLRMLRTTGTELPVELFLADESEYNATICEQVLPALNARCIIMSQVFAPRIEHFQYKVFAILLSSFQ